MVIFVAPPFASRLVSTDMTGVFHRTEEADWAEYGGTTWAVLAMILLTRKSRGVHEPIHVGSEKYGFNQGYM